MLSVVQNHKIIQTAKDTRDHFNSVQRYHAVVDMSLHASKHRFFLVDLDENEIIYSWYTSHGIASGGRDKALYFSNTPNSKQSSLGAYKTAEVYYSEKFNGKSIRLDGLDKTNSNARKRAIVLHPAWYVSEDFISSNDLPGRSEGCITLDPLKSDWVINLLTGGSLISVINYD